MVSKLIRQTEPQKSIQNSLCKGPEVRRTAKQVPKDDATVVASKHSQGQVLASGSGASGPLPASRAWPAGSPH